MDKEKINSMGISLTTAQWNAIDQFLKVKEEGNKIAFQYMSRVLDEVKQRHDVEMLEARIDELESCPIDFSVIETLRYLNKRINKLKEQRKK